MAERDKLIGQKIKIISWGEDTTSVSTEYEVTQLSEGNPNDPRLYDEFLLKKINADESGPERIHLIRAVILRARGAV